MLRLFFVVIDNQAANLLREGVGTLVLYNGPMSGRQGEWLL